MELDIKELTEEKLDENVIVRGKIDKYRKIGMIEFAQIFDQTGQCQVVLEKTEKNTDFKMKKGDFIEVKGRLVNNSYGEREVQVEEIRVIGYSNERSNQALIEKRKFDKLIIRSHVLGAIREFLCSRNVFEVSSPTIVGNWVEGKTNSFEVNYFGEKNYLTLNNMLYHQVMVISGYTRIYEIAKVFRQDNSSPKNRLSEFYSLDISIAHVDTEFMLEFIEDLIKYIIEKLSKIDKSLSYDCTFDKIDYVDLLEKSGCKEHSGAQLSSKSRAYLNNNYKGFVWLVGSPEDKRRFFVKREDGVCNDYQLWYRGEAQVAAGSEREGSVEELKKRILQEDKSIEQYAEFLRYYENGVPKICEIGFGLERFLMYVTNSDSITDFIAFPRNGKKIKV